MARSTNAKAKRHQPARESVIINGQTVGKDEKILIEKGGKFELVSASKLKTMLPPINKERPMSPVTQTSSTTVKMASIKKDKIVTSDINEKQTKTKPQEPTKAVILGRPRVRSANTDTRKKSRFTEGGVTRKSKSADSSRKNRFRSRNEVVDKHQIESPYAMTPELKKAMKKLGTMQAAKKREEERQRQLEEDEAMKEAQKAWEAWLKHKNEELKKEQKSSKVSKQSKKEKMRQHQEAVNAFNHWVSSKKIQRRNERLLKQQEQIEYDELWYVRGRKECDKAFNAWVRGKHQEEEKKKQREIDAKKQTKIAARRARRTQNLMRSVMDAQQMKYVEYYGYRF